MGVRGLFQDSPLLGCLPHAVPSGHTGWACSRSSTRRYSFWVQCMGFLEELAACAVGSLLQQRVPQNKTQAFSPRPNALQKENSRGAPKVVNCPEGEGAVDFRRRCGEQNLPRFVSFPCLRVFGEGMGTVASKCLKSPCVAMHTHIQARCSICPGATWTLVAIPLTQ